MNTKNFLSKTMRKKITLLAFTGVLASSGLIETTTPVNAAALSQSSIVISTTIHPTSVVITKTSDTLTVGGTDTLTATAAPSNATNKNVTWTSSNPNVAKVINGVITAVSAGKATITATTTDGNKTTTCSVTVNPVVHPISVSLNKTTDTLTVGGTDTLTATVAPSNATNQNVTWTSSNPKIVTVNNGVITGVSAGTATITATTVDGNKTAGCSVTVATTILAPKGSMDTPANGATLSGTTTTSGWFLDGNGVNKVEVLVDGTVVGTASYGASRNDVAAAFPAYKTSNCGYNYSLDTTKLINGSHKIVIRETSNANVQTSLSGVAVTVSNASSAIAVSNMLNFQTALTNAIINRVKSVQITYNGTTPLTGYPSVLGTIIPQITSTAGNDYEKLLLDKCSYSATAVKGSNQFTVTYTLDYLETPEQSSQVKAKVDTILSQIITPGMTNEHIEKAINDWICKNVAYDTTLTNHTAYAALFGNRKTVCEGYSLLAYRMLTEAGLNARIVTGTGNGEAHAWNMVKIAGAWYHLDTTWNDPVPDVAGRTTYTYFNLDDTQIKASNHVWIAASYPACSTVFIPTDPNLLKSIVNVASVGISKTTDTLTVGRTDTLTATIAPSNATNQNVTWTSSNPSVATVNNGVITGVCAGTTTITATTADGNKTASCSVTVNNLITTVTVKNPNGTLANFANVSISTLDSSFTRTYSGSISKFSICGLADGTYNIVAFPDKNSKFANSIIKTITIVNGAVSPASNANIELDFTNPQITGTVKNPDGSLATSGCVTISGASVKTNVNIYNGKFLIGGLADGTYNIVASPDENSQFVNSITKTITIVNGSVLPASNANIELDFTKPQITGTVKNPDGSLATSGSIGVSLGNIGLVRIININNGKFIIGDLADGTYNIAATPSGDSKFTPSITKTITIVNGAVSPASNANIELDFTNPQITGTVKNPDGSLATSGWVFVSIQNKGTVSLVGINNGTFSMSSLADGTYNIAASPSGNSKFAPSIAKTITIVNGAISPASNANIELDFTNPIIGTVKNPDGTLANSGYVAICGMGMSTGVNISNGIFSIRNLPDGTYNLVASPSGNSQFTQSITKTITIVNGAVSPASGANIELDFTKNKLVTFKDKNLEQAIRQQINKPTGDILKSDVEKIIILGASAEGIQDISGIEYLTNLDYLYLGSNQISDISLLKELTNLHYLNLQNNKISDADKQSLKNALPNCNIYF